MAITSTSGSLASPGVGSGLDVTAIVNKLMAVESLPLNALAQKQTSYEARISAFGTLKGNLSALQTTLSAFTSASGMRKLTAMLGDPAVATATAGSSAVAGSYSLTVTQLAQAHKIASAGFASVADAVGSGTLTFEFGSFAAGTFTANPDATGGTVTIAAGQNTLGGIRDAVNAAGVGVTATIVNDGSASGNRLVFTSQATGAANSLKLTVADADGGNTDASGLSQLAYDPAAAAGSGQNLSQIVAARNALLTLDGIDITKASNTITDAIDGVTLKLSKTNVGAPTTLSLAYDDSGIAEQVQAFVKAYNDLSATITKLTNYDPATNKGSTLTGDSTVRGIQSQLRAALGTTLADAGLSLSALWQVGVKFKEGNVLTVDTAKLEQAVGTNAAGVSGLFAGIGKVADTLITGFLGSDGVVATATEGASKRIKDIGRQRDAMQLRLDQVQARYLAQFRALDTLISSMSATSDYLTQQLANLPSTSRNN